MTITSFPERIVLHCGLPKTGTTALQHWCTANREELLRHGVDYPLVEIAREVAPITNDRTPKHGFLIAALRNRDMSAVQRAMENAAAPTLLLSTEGLTNHFYSFPEESLALLREAFGGIPIDLMIVFREKEKWARSLWKEGVIAFPGTTLGYKKFLSLPAIQALSDWPQLIKDMKSQFGARDVLEVSLEEKGWKTPLLDYLGISGFDEVPETRDQFNVSISDDLIELVRRLNTQRLDPMLRLMLFSVIQSKFTTSHLTLQNAYDWGLPDRNQALRLKRALHATGSLPKSVAEVKGEILRKLNAQLADN
mgnify:CR=1 FL=1